MIVEETWSKQLYGYWLYGLWISQMLIYHLIFKIILPFVPLLAFKAMDYILHIVTYHEYAIAEPNTQNIIISLCIIWILCELAWVFMRMLFIHGRRKAEKISN